MEKPSHTHFGFKEVPWEEKKQKVEQVFNSVANKYDLMNDLMSLGIHRLWKKIALQKVAPKTGDVILDLAGGTGDLSLALAKKVGKEGNVILADINSTMLNLGRDKIINNGFISNVTYILANAERIPINDNSINSIIIAYGLRNITDKQAALLEMYRVLQPGGSLVILEFSKVKNSQIEKLYDFYSFNILPTLGKIVLNDANSYQYLAESIRKHPNQEELKSMLQQANFEECSYQNLSFGVSAIHTGYKF